MVEQIVTSGDRTLVILDNSNWLDLFSDPMLPFALDELLCKQAAKSQIHFCHIWRHPNAFILGQQDARLPEAQSAINWLASQHYIPIVRNSGGAAVPLDDGVINISLIFPILQKQQHFHDDFEKMVQLITAALSPFSVSVQKGEIAGGYCPGDFDLSMNGLKFCGIAQRRQLHAYCVQAFVNVMGSGSKRASLVRQFYNIAGQNAAPGSFPNIIDVATASLEELLPSQQLSVDSFIEAIKQTIMTIHHHTSVESSNESKAVYSSNLKANYSLPDHDELLSMTEQLHKRYSSL